MKASLLVRLQAVCAERNSVLCVGIDPDPDRLPSHLSPDRDPIDAVRRFTRDIIRHTAPYTACFKFNLAFFEALGPKGLEVLSDVLSDVPDDIITIADAKRGDIGNSARFYARAFFDDYGFDAITISPYMGSDSVVPFLEYEGKGVFMLVRTSNPGGNDLQTIPVNGVPLYEAVASAAMKWEQNTPGMLGFVVGATDLNALGALRDLCPDTPFLIPGVGAQGGTASSVIQAAGSGPLLVNSSRQIIYASDGDDFAHRAAEEASRLRDSLSTSLEAISRPARQQ